MSNMMFCWLYDLLDPKVQIAFLKLVFLMAVETDNQFCCCCTPLLLILLSRLAVFWMKPTCFQSDEENMDSDRRVAVKNTETGEILQGENAPKFSNLDAWLEMHPNFQASALLCQQIMTACYIICSTQLC